MARKGPFTDPVTTAVYGILGGLTALCVLMIGVRIVRLDSDSFRFLLWNLFLAWLPLIVSGAAVRSVNKLRGQAGRLFAGLSAIVWLFLYPNAPYLTTDFVHLIMRSYDIDSLRLWYDLVLFFLFSWCGLMIGYVSLRHFHAIVRHYSNDVAGWLFVLAVSVLGGFGIYLGRVSRLNSWDALFNPFRLIEGILDGLNHDALIFTGLFGLLILILYLSLYALRNERNQARLRTAASRNVPDDLVRGNHDSASDV